MYCLKIPRKSFLIWKIFSYVCGCGIIARQKLVFLWLKSMRKLEAWFQNSLYLTESFHQVIKVERVPKRFVGILDFPYLKLGMRDLKAIRDWKSVGLDEICYGIEEPYRGPSVMELTIKMISVFIWINFICHDFAFKWGWLHVYNPAYPIDGNRCSENQSINRYQSIKLVNWYWLVLVKW